MDYWGSLPSHCLGPPRRRRAGLPAVDELLLARLLPAVSTGVVNDEALARRSG